VRGPTLTRCRSIRADALFWLVHEIDGARVVRIQKGAAEIFPRLNAMINGVGARSSKPMRLTKGSPRKSRSE